MEKYYIYILPILTFYFQVPGGGRVLSPKKSKKNIDTKSLEVTADTLPTKPVKLTSPKVVKLVQILLFN